MITYCSAKDFITQRADIPTIDVRSPSEFQHGHIPGAMNIPLFSDEERAIVGTTYKQRGRETAIIQGLEIVGNKLAQFVTQAQQLAGEQQKIQVYCWRGGMRSASMAWLFNTVIPTVFCLTGGYKAFREAGRKSIEQLNAIRIVHGYTGSGKTHILHFLQQMGEQVLDLEHYAHHRGSAFGAIALPPQPSTEMFHNYIFDNVLSVDTGKTLWIEGESKNIGSVVLPEELWQKMVSSTKIVLLIPTEQRIKNIINDYGSFQLKDLIQSTEKLQKKLGGAQTQQVTEAINQGNLVSAIEILLNYYDQGYAYALSRYDSSTVLYQEVPENALPQDIATMLIEQYSPRITKIRH